MRRYIHVLQPVKSVVIEILNKLRRSSEKSSNFWDLDVDNIPAVDKTMHVGICRSADSDETAIAKNVKKTRGTLYSLMSARLHGENINETLQKYLKCIGKHSVKVQISIDTENKIMHSRELERKIML